MPIVEKNRILAATMLVGAAAAWPSVLCFLTDAMASPLDRALRTSFCGGATEVFAVFGHCPACWAGSATFALLAAFVMKAPRVIRIGG